MTTAPEELSVEIRRRINVAVWAYAYEIENDPLVDDATFDREALLVRPEITTDYPLLDRFFQTEFAPYTGQWVHRHPDKPGLKRIAAIKRGALAPVLRGPRTMTDQSPAPESPALDAAIRAYRDLREDRAALKKEFDEIDKGLKARMESLEAALLGKMDSLGVKQLKTASGLAYVETTHKPTCGDWDAFYNWVMETGRLDCLQKRLATTAVNDLVKDTGELPPGCSLVSERVVGIRK